MSDYFPRALTAPPSPTTRAIVLLSDIEMGEPGRFDDFPHDAFLAELIAGYAEPPYDGIPVDLVLNGDVFDFLKMSHDGSFPRHVTSDIALEKLEIILESHPGFLEGLRAFGTHSSGTKRIHFVVGNHDPELLFGQVVGRLRELLPDVPRLRFHGLQCRLGPVLIEHGHQDDPMFRMDPHHLFHHYQGARILNLPWGSTALTEVAMPLRDHFYHHDRLIPKAIVLERMPLVNEVLIRSFKRYWMRDYIMNTLREWSDPTRRISWEMVKEVLYRFYSGNASVVVRDQGVEDRLYEDPGLEAICQAHLHIPTWKMHGKKLLIRTGCMRDEFMLNRHNDVLEAVPKSYGEIILEEDHVTLSRLFHVDGPERAPGTYPEDPFAFTPEMQQILQQLRSG